MKTTRQRQKALKALNYDLFRAETLSPPAPATLHSKIAQATEQARPERVSVSVCSTPGERAELPTVEELYRLFDRFNWLYFGGKLPKVKIVYSTRMAAAGSYSTERRLIKMGRRYHEIFPQDIEDTLKHEMIHIIHHHHDAAFKREAKRIGATLKAQDHPALRRPPKFVYECPCCGMEYPRQKRLIMASCGKCSAGRRFDPRYKLRRKKTPPVPDVR